LYGCNTFGAVGGVLAAEVLLVERFGISGTAWIAAMLNGTSAAIALWLTAAPHVSRGIHHQEDRERSSGRFGRSTSGVPVSIQTVPGDEQPRPQRTDGGGRLLACAFLAGAILMALEVVWFRFLSMFVVSSTLAVSLMLAV